MAGPWDSITKRMIGANPEHFVKWLESEATFVAALDIELKSQHIFADALLKITRRKKPALLQIELQTYYDPDIQMRLLEYNVLASRQYDHLPVYSYVICLREEADVADPPLIRRFPDDEGEEVHRFFLSSDQAVEDVSRFNTSTGVGRLVTSGDIDRGRKKARSGAGND